MIYFCFEKTQIHIKQRRKCPFKNLFQLFTGLLKPEKYAHNDNPLKHSSFKFEAYCFQNFLKTLSGWKDFETSGSRNLTIALKLL